MSEYFVSIIIPTWRESTVLNRCLESLFLQNYPKEKFEVILVSKDYLNIDKREVKMVHIGQEVNHAESRNIAVRTAKGEIIGFIDDDCLVPKDWISKGVKYFKDKKIGLIGGPALPPEKQSFSYRAGAYLMASPFGTGPVRLRYGKASKTKEVNESDLMLCNNFVRKDVFEEVGGFDKNQVPCEENDLYLRILKNGYKLLYVPENFVWHKSKPIFLPLAQKIYFYSTGRGILTARRPQNLKLIFIIPSAFLLNLIALVFLSFFWPVFLDLLALVVIVYLFLAFLNTIYIFVKFEKNLLLFLVMPVAVFLAHLSSGAGFLSGVYKFFTNQWRGGIKMKTKY